MTVKNYVARVQGMVLIIPAELDSLELAEILISRWKEHLRLKSEAGE